MCHSDVQRTLIPVQPPQASALHERLQFTDIYLDCLHDDSTEKVWRQALEKKTCFAFALKCFCPL